MSFLINERFTTGTRPTDWWSGSTGDFGYATAPAPLEGSFSLLIDPAQGGQSLYIHASEQAGESWGHFMFLYTPGLPSNFHHIFELADDAFNTLFKITINANGTMTLTGMNAFEITSGTITADALYHLWWRFKQGTGSNAELEMWVSPGTDRASAPSNLHKLFTTGNLTGAPKYHSFSAVNGDGQAYNIVDVVQWADADEFAGGAAARPFVTTLGAKRIGARR
jgi:hypothetical protein